VNYPNGVQKEVNELRDYIKRLNKCIDGLMAEIKQLKEESNGVAISSDKERNEVQDS